MLLSIALLASIDITTCPKFLYKSDNGQVVLTCEEHWDRTIYGMYEKTCDGSQILYIPTFDKRAPKFYMHSENGEKIKC